MRAPLPCATDARTASRKARALPLPPPPQARHGVTRRVRSAAAAATAAHFRPTLRHGRSKHSASDATELAPPFQTRGHHNNKPTRLATSRGTAPVAPPHGGLGEQPHGPPTRLHGGHTAVHRCRSAVRDRAVMKVWQTAGRPAGAAPLPSLAAPARVPPPPPSRAPRVRRAGVRTAGRHTGAAMASAALLAALLAASAALAGAFTPNTPPLESCVAPHSDLSAHDVDCSNPLLTTDGAGWSLVRRWATANT